MTNLIDGKAIAAKIKEEVKIEAAELAAKNITPHLAVILVGNNPASLTYVNAKRKACEETGIRSTVKTLDESVTENELIEQIEKLNQDDTVHAILVQLPLPNHISKERVINAISPEKDVDGFHPYNVEKLLTDEGTWPCTPKGIIRLLHEYNIPISGQNIAVIGRSDIVGKPTARLLEHMGGHVTVCHSKTEDIPQITKRADLIIVAVGKRNILTDDMVKDGATIIDVGINKKDDGKLCGDVDFEVIKFKAKHITPVPGGVGPMTIAMLLKNTLRCARRIGKSWNY